MRCQVRGYIEVIPVVGLIYAVPCTLVCVMLGSALIDEKIKTIYRLSPVKMKLLFAAGYLSLF